LKKLILLNNWFFLKKITEQKIIKQKITEEMIFENITEQMIFWKYALNDRKNTKPQKLDNFGFKLLKYKLC
jgi:hypothetical protein